MPKRVMERIWEKIRLGQYDMTCHAREEMVEDELNLFDIEQAILTGKLIRTEKGELRGTKYTILGKGINQQTMIGVVGRFKETGRFLIITVYEVKDF